LVSGFQDDPVAQAGIVFLPVIVAGIHGGSDLDGAGKGEIQRLTLKNWGQVLK
jgi:hypothetical protein